MRVAVIHDWLTGMRGGESVLEGILDVVPDADIYTLFHFRGSVSERIERHTIHTSSLQRLATRVRDYRHLLPLFARAVGEWDLSAYDAIISSSHAVVKGVDAKGRPHLCYCHTPMRYIWDRFDDYFPRGVARMAMKVIAGRLRRWDVRTSAGVTQFVANSNFVKERIRRFYDRGAVVVHPFVDDEFLSAPLVENRGDEHVIVSALVPYKRIDLAIDAFAASGKRLVIIGKGPLHERFAARRAPNVELAGFVSKRELIERLARAQSLILPGIEDFGITPLEAMALGTPVVAFGEGGVLDSVVDGSTGILFRAPMADALRRAVDDAERRTWDRNAIRAHAATFSRDNFDRQFGQLFESLLRSTKHEARSTTHS
jgi:glycosyltransferase involved in cell wall biosynthesis